MNIKTVYQSNTAKSKFYGVQKERVFGQQHNILYVCTRIVCTLTALSGRIR